jgi:hypothetical protein
MDVIYDKDKVLEIFDGPDKRMLWTQTPKLDEWTAPKEVTLLPVTFLIGTKFDEPHTYYIYLEQISTMQGDTIFFKGTTIDPVTSQSATVEGQFDYKAKTGLVEFKDRYI